MLDDRYPYLDVPFAALAHRGGHCAAAPPGLENSLVAFRAAWDLGYRYLETDVHTTSDGRLVAFHDERLDRVTDASGALADLPWAEVARARIGGREAVPALDDLLDALPHARFNIDIKAPGAVRPLVEAIRRHAAEDRVCVGSFSDARLAEFRRLTSGRVATSASPREVAVFALAPGVRRLWPLRGQVFQMPMRETHTGIRLLSREMLEAAHRAGARVHVWTVNDPVWMHKLIDLGVDGIVSDDIETLRDVLVARDLWEGHA